MKKYLGRVLGPQKPVDQDSSQETSPLFPKKALNSYQLNGGIKAQYILYLTISLALTYYKIIKPMHLTEACLGTTLMLRYHI